MLNHPGLILSARFKAEIKPDPFPSLKIAMPSQFSS